MYKTGDKSTEAENIIFCLVSFAALLLKRIALLGKLYSSTLQGMIVYRFKKVFV